MYKPIFPEYAQVNDDMSIYGPKAHQRVISKLNSGLGPLFYREHCIQLEPLPETMLDEGQASPVPDLILYDNTARTTPIIIEVCHTDGLRKDLKKVIALLEADDYGIQEGFVYDYITAQWYRYSKGDGGLTQSTSFSEVLQLDLNQFL
ncbi:hypothetical protein G8759_09765 [Spirosoma aureum]|uniref:Uma2 family endonuclease n=1 Tax=Spirosoma aureum TaxID=2692134 RepID=A0A6G9AK97_9BACT|nr:hypothetical protein [Spirosoma aureum]QIP12892.1 hypothetical protein G8759_09765 [Spirosoma aureum]